MWILLTSFIGLANCPMTSNCPINDELGGRGEGGRGGGEGGREGGGVCLFKWFALRGNKSQYNGKKKY